MIRQSGPRFAKNPNHPPAVPKALSQGSIEGGSLNAYEYAGQDPCNSYDLTGTISCRGGWFGGAIRLFGLGDLFRAGHQFRRGNKAGAPRLLAEQAFAWGVGRGVKGVIGRQSKIALRIMSRAAWPLTLLATAADGVCNGPRGTGRWGRNPNGSYMSGSRSPYVDTAGVPMWPRPTYR